MNDRFRFRAWIKEVKEMCYDDEKNTDFTTRVMQSQQDDVIFMQSTGLRDKNGKLLYESDITNKGVIVWHRAGFYLKMEGCLFIALGDELIQELEIIGNIHENPELWEEK